MRNHIFTIGTLVADRLDRLVNKFGMRRKTLGSCASLLLAIFVFANCGQSPTPGSNDNSSKAQVISSSTPTPGSETASPSATSSASIVANPNPVSAGKSFGKTTITWNTGDGTVGQVYVSEGGAPEKLFADERPQGSQDAPWIGAGTPYEFRLYAGKEHKNLLASVKVTRNDK